MDAFDRCMSRANAAVENTSDARAAMRRRVEERRANARSKSRDDDDAPNALTVSRDAIEDEDVVSAVLSAYDARDYFAVLNVRRPGCDDAGRPTWDVSDAELNRAFRKASLRVHPDKNRASDARRAFDAIGETQKMFRDPVKRGEILRAAAEEAFREKCKRNPELLRMRARVLESANAAEYAEEMRRQREEAKRRAEERRNASKKNARRRREESDEEGNALEAMAKNLEEEEAAKAREDGDGSDDEGGIALKRKPKKRFMF